MLYWFTIYMYIAALICSVSKADEEHIKLFHTEDSRNWFTNLLSSLIKINEHRINSINKMSRLQDHAAIRNSLRTSDRSYNQNKDKSLLIIVPSNSISAARKRVPIEDSVVSYSESNEQTERPQLTHITHKKHERLTSNEQYEMTRQHPKVKIFQYTLKPQRPDDYVYGRNEPRQRAYTRPREERHFAHSRKFQNEKQTTDRFKQNEMSQYNERDSLSDDLAISEGKATISYFQKQPKTKQRPVKSEPIINEAVEKAIETHIKEYIKSMNMKGIKTDSQMTPKVNVNNDIQRNVFYKPNDKQGALEESEIGFIVPKPQQFSPVSEASYKFEENIKRIPESILNFPVSKFAITHDNLDIPHRFSVQPKFEIGPTTNYYNNIPYQFKDYSNQVPIRVTPGLPAPPGAYRHFSLPETEPSKRLSLPYIHMPDHPKEAAAIAHPTIFQMTQQPSSSFQDFTFEKTEMAKNLNKLRQGTTSAAPAPKQNVLKIEMGLNDKHEDKHDTEIDQVASEYVPKIHDDISDSESSKTEFHISESEPEHSYSNNHKQNDAIKSALRINTNSRKNWQRCIGKKAYKKCKNACFNSYKRVCRQLKCTSGARKDLKRECIKNCKHSFQKSNTKTKSDGSSSDSRSE